MTVSKSAFRKQNRGRWGNAAHRIIPPTQLFSKKNLDDHLAVCFVDGIWCAAEECELCDLKCYFRDFA